MCIGVLAPLILNVSLHATRGMGKVCVVTLVSNHDSDGYDGSGNGRK